MIEELLKNIDNEIDILKEIALYNNKLSEANQRERKILLAAISSLREGIRILNASVPKIMQGISLAKKLPGKHESGLERISFKRNEKGMDAVLRSEDKERFLSELRINNEALEKLGGEKQEQEVSYAKFKGSNFYLKASNRMFVGLARNMIKRGKFKTLATTLKKSNLDILFESYVSAIFFTTFLAVCFSAVLYVLLIFLDFSVSAPFIQIYSDTHLKRVGSLIWVPLIIPILFFLGSYFYPSTERGSIERRIDQELPFAVVHMSAISGSGIEPTSIFKIIVLGKEYPYLKKEVRKILNQINLYGYDLVTALNNVAKNSPSKKLSELLSGMASTITSGGSLSNFFEKRAETLLLNYRLEREKFTKSAETFMDLYITVVIVAPMILLLIFILLSISEFGPSISPGYIAFMIIAIITLINIIFLGIIHIKQPAY
ncbi:MAG: type II secretion system F family protein [Nanoarchaeota archaeon]